MISYIGRLLVILALKNLSFDLNFSSGFLSDRHVKFIPFISLLNIFYFMASKRLIILRLLVVSRVPFDWFFIIWVPTWFFIFHYANIIIITFIALILLIIENLSNLTGSVCSSLAPYLTFTPKSIHPWLSIASFRHFLSSISSSSRRRVKVVHSRS
jgi:hypothetical protein